MCAEKAERGLGLRKEKEEGEEVANMREGAIYHIPDQRSLPSPIYRYKLISTEREDLELPFSSSRNLVGGITQLVPSPDRGRRGRHHFISLLIDRLPSSLHHKFRTNIEPAPTLALKALL